MATIHDGKVIGPCSMCKWWHAREYHSAEGVVFGPKGYCWFMASKGASPDYPQSLAHALCVDEGRTHWAALQADANFGCVQWEVRS